MNDDYAHILQRYHRTHQYLQSDPEIALSEARKTTEAILKDLYRQQQSLHPNDSNYQKNPDKLMLNKLAGILDGANIYPLVVATSIRTIQAFGNIGSHDQDGQELHLDAQSARTCINALDTLMKWFWQQHNLNLLDLEIKEPKKTSKKMIYAMAILGFCLVLCWQYLMGSQPSKADIAQVYQSFDIPIPPDSCIQETSQTLEMLQTLEFSQIPQDIQQRSLLVQAIQINDMSQNDNASNSQEDLIRRLEMQCADWAFVSAMWGNYWFKQNHLDQSETHFKKALQLQAEYPKIQYNLALLLFKMHRSDEALNLLNQLLKDNPQHSNGYLLRANIYSGLAQWDLARTDGIKALNNTPDNPKVLLLLLKVEKESEHLEEMLEYACALKKLGHPIGKQLCTLDD